MRLLLMLLFFAPLLCYAQETPATAGATAAGATVAGMQTSQAFGSVTGQVTDSSGALVPGAIVTLTLGQLALKATTDSEGEFDLSGVPSGDFAIKATADGLQPGKATGSLLPGERLEFPPIVLRVAQMDTDVEVTFTREELGVAEVQAEEKQRVFGFLPNFSVAYDWNAPPMTTAQKYHVAMKAVIDPVSVGIAAGVAGVQQATNSFAGYGPGPSGYGKRFGANMGDALFGTFLTGAVFPEVFHQDPRYFWKGSGTVRSRVLYALESVLICRDDKSEKREANYSNVLGSLSAGALSNLYYPTRNRDGVSLTFENTLLGLAGGGVSNIIQEFLLHRITPRLPRATAAPSP
jgi:hypothetical protein